VKLFRHRSATVLAILVTLAFLVIVLRWIVVMDLAADVDTHRLTAEEETQLLAKKAANREERKP